MSHNNSPEPQSRKSSQSAGPDIRCFIVCGEWSHVPIARKQVISAPEQANNTVSKRGNGQAESPTHLLLTASSHSSLQQASIHPYIHVSPLQRG